MAAQQAKMVIAEVLVVVEAENRLQVVVVAQVDLGNLVKETLEEMVQIM